jgi:hypothetical protein
MKQNIIAALHTAHDLRLTGYIMYDGDKARFSAGGKPKISTERLIYCLNNGAVVESGPTSFGLNYKEIMVEAART